MPNTRLKLPLKVTHLDSLSINGRVTHVLFLATLITSIFIYVTAMFLVNDLERLKNTLPIMTTCLIIMLSLYGLITITKRFDTSLAITYGLMILIVYMKMKGFNYVFFTMAAYGLYQLIKFKFQKDELISAVQMGLIGAAAILANDNSNPFSVVERLNSGSANLDTLYHASIAAMIKNYGVASTGLHGLVETPYHIFSHELIAAISKLSEAGVFEIYGGAPRLLFLPILILTIINCCNLIHQCNTEIAKIRWLICCITLALMPQVFSPWAIWNSYFTSESYMVSLGLLLVGLPLLFVKKYKLADILLVIFIGALAARSKGSVGLIYWGLWFLKILLLNINSKATDLSAFIGLTLAILLVTYQSIDASAPTTITYFDFIEFHSFMGGNISKIKLNLYAGESISTTTFVFTFIALISFAAFHFILSWIVIYATYIHHKLFNLPREAIIIYNAGAMFAGIFVVLFFNLPAGAAYYITNIPFFVALPFLIIYLSNLILNQTYILNIFKIKIAKIFSMTILTYVLLLGLYNAKIIYSTNQGGKPSENSFVGLLLDIRRNSPVNIYLNPNPVVMAQNPVVDCMTQPFVYSAIAERPWINVILPRQNCNYQNYSYEQYGLTKDSQFLAAPQNIPSKIRVLLWPISTSENN